MDITVHIKDLLFSHDCVIIPGFGGFVCNYTPAVIDKATGMLYPPSKQVSFNRNLNHNDGLLVGRISAVTGLPYGDARNIAGDYSSDLQRRLMKGEKVELQGIGSFLNNHEGNIQFEPERGINYNLNSFGLEPISFAPASQFERHGRKLAVPSARRDEKSRLSRYLWRAAVLVPVAGAIAAVTLTTDLFRKGDQLTSMNPLANVEFDSNRKANETKAEEKPGPVKPAAEETKIANEPAEIKNESPAFMIIAGSFQSESNAEFLMNKLAAEGFKPELIKAPNGFLRVCAARFGSLGEAVAGKDSISLKFPGSWITKANQ